MTGSSTPVPIALETELRRELTGGERVLWSAQPLARRLKAGFGIWLFAVPWTVFALFWISMALLPWASSSKTPDGIKWSFGIAMPLFGVPFVLIGLWMLWKPIQAMRQAKQTVYALTDNRLIRLVLTKRREVSSVLLDQIGPMTRSESPDGTGHLRIQTHSRIDSDGDRITERFEVLGVADVARLERLILESQRG
jgi:hypothetical protein